MFSAGLREVELGGAGMHVLLAAWTALILTLLLFPSCEFGGQTPAHVHPASSRWPESWVELTWPRGLCGQWEPGPAARRAAERKLFTVAGVGQAGFTRISAHTAELVQDEGMAERWEALTVSPLLQPAAWFSPSRFACLVSKTRFRGRKYDEPFKWFILGPLLPRCFGGELGRKWSSLDLNWCPSGMLVPQAAALPISPTALGLVNTCEVAHEATLGSSWNVRVTCGCRPVVLCC